MKLKFTLAIASFLTAALQVNAQSKTTISGLVKDNSSNPVQSVTVSLLKAKDSSLVKAGFTDKAGSFEIESVKSGQFLLSYTSVGFDKKYSTAFKLEDGQNFVAPVVKLDAASKKLQDVVVTAKKPMIEVKVDKIVFNVENSINATGSNALELLQKSPGVMVDNNDNISMKGKSGIKIYIDGKMTQLDSKSLADYLKSINSNDIEAIEMVANPGAKYDASGNAGIINIRLKKNKKYGTNGSADIGLQQGITPKGNAGLSLNYRDKKINLFSNVGGFIGRREASLGLYRIQKDTIFDGHNSMINNRKSINVKAGADYFINSKNTIGVLVTTNISDGNFKTNGSTLISYQPTNQLTKTLLSSNTAPNHRANTNFNLNYRYTDTSGTEIGFDADYGLFRSTGSSYQPNNYYSNDKILISSYIFGNNTPIDINIYTAKLDVEHKLGKGKLGYGLKTAFVKTSNAFDFYNYVNNVPSKDMNLSNSFVYTENVNAAYVNYNRTFNTKWSLQTGLRLEQTNSEGDLTRADGLIQADNTVKRNYLNLFPSAAISYNINAKNTVGLTYSRRIDRPSYQDLNPFENKIDQLTFEKGNAFLRPQYTDNVELSHTFASKINTSISYSYVKDYAVTITDTTNGNATYIQRRNIAAQKIIGFNVGSPLPIAKWWNGYANIWYNYQIVKGEFNGIDVNIKAPGYGAYMQNTFTLGKNYTAEISGWYNGKGLEGTWNRKAMGGMDIGLQKLILDKKATVKLTVTDVLHSINFHANSSYGGTDLTINQRNENQTVRLNFSYRFGSNQIKAARQRKTGLESEGDRIK